MADLSNDEIYSTVQKIIEYALRPRMQQLMTTKPAEYNRELQTTFQEFLDKCPALFFSIMDNPKTFDLRRLREMLDKRKQIIEKKITQEEADKEMGQKYYDEFVKPHVDERDK